MTGILVATDLSSRSHAAIARAYKLAAERSTELRILHAVPSPFSAKQSEETRREIQELVHATGQELRTDEPKFAINIVVGKPEQAILRTAADCNAELIVLGGHGQPRFRDALFGTTAEHVVGHAMPVLIAQNPAATSYRRLLIAADEDDLELLVQAASKISQPNEISVVHACDSILAELLGPVPGLPDPSDEFALRQRTRNAAAASGMPASVIVHSIVDRGDARDVVFRASTSVDPDLLVVGTHGRHGLRSWLMGSNADAAIFACPSDLLVVPLDTKAPHA